MTLTHRLTADTPGERYDAIRRGIQFIAVGCLQIHTAMPGKPWPVRWVEIRDDGRLTHQAKAIPPDTPPVVLRITSPR